MSEFSHCQKWKGYETGPEKGTSNSHAQVLVVMVQISGFFKGKGTIVPREVSYPTYDHFTQGRVYIKEKGSINVPATHFSEMSLIPAHPGRLVHFLEPGPASED